MATNTVTTEQVHEAIEQLAAMVAAASISPQTIADILEMMRNLNDQEKEKVIEVANAKILEIQESLSGIIAKSPGTNLLDKSRVKEGYFINASGGETASQFYNCTDYIPVTAGEIYSDATESSKAFRAVDFYDTNSVHLSTRYEEQHTFTVPADAAYMRLSLYKDAYAYALVAKSSERIAYIPFTPIGGYNAVNLQDGVVTENKVANGAITENKLSAAIQEKLSIGVSTKNDVVFKSPGTNLFDKAKVTKESIVGPSGSIVTGYPLYVTSGLIECVEGNKYSKAVSNSDFRCVGFYDSNKDFLSRIENSGTFTAPENAAYFRVTILTSQLSTAQVTETESPLAYVEYNPIGGHIAEKLKDGTVSTDKIQNKAVTLGKLADGFPFVNNIEDYFSTNLANPSDFKDGYWNNGEKSSTYYQYVKIDVLRLTAGTTLSFIWSNGISASARLVQFYNGTTRDAEAGGENITSAVIPANVDSVYVSFEKTDRKVFGVFNSINPTWESYSAYAVAKWTEKPNDAPQALVRFADIESLVATRLKGKKWAPLGDSFTAGVTSSSIADGKYAGKKKSYPFFIGNRTEINVLETFFQSGRTLAFPETPGDFANSICNPSAACYYQNIPVDVDYITIYLGINDSHHAPGSGGGDGEDNTGVIPIGTITDNTTHTYYGAWNVLLSWLIENRPFAHIGIIVSNGCDTADYRTAQLAIARKYGIPFIDLNGDDRTPCMIRSLNTNIASAVRQMRTLKQAVDYDGSRTGSVNLHPNDDAHLYESYFIEEFLMTL